MRLGQQRDPPPRGAGWEPTALVAVEPNGSQTRHSVVLAQAVVGQEGWMMIDFAGFGFETRPHRGSMITITPLLTPTTTTPYQLNQRGAHIDLDLAMTWVTGGYGDYCGWRTVPYHPYTQTYPTPPPPFYTYYWARWYMPRGRGGITNCTILYSGAGSPYA